MAKYQAIYKCRLCGETIEYGTIECDQILGFQEKEGIVVDKKMSMIRVAICESHNCKDGSCGMLDFQGFRKVE